jgi:capsular polysaccharide biosynthesis protein
MVNTYAIIIKSNTVLNEVIDTLQLNMKYKTLAEKITVGAVDATQVMRVSVQDADPALAKQIVEQIAAIAPERIVEAVEAGSCKVISDVEAGEEPVSPSLKKYIAVCALAPLFVGLVQAAFYVEITSEAVGFCSGCGFKLTSEVETCPNCGRAIR